MFQNRIICWKKLDEVTDFSQLDEDQLNELTCGSHHMELASSTPKYTVKVHFPYKCIMKIKVRIWMKSQNFS